MATIMTLMAKLGLDAADFHKGIAGAEKGASGLGSKLSGAAGIAGKAMLGVGVAAAGMAVGVGTAAFKLATNAAPIEGISRSFEGLGGNLEDLREGALGMVSDADLMLSYNSAAGLVSQTFANQLPEAMGALSKVSAATGQDMGFMMDSLVKGVGRLSPMILDNLGIQVSLADATASASAQFGVEAEELTKTQIQAGMMSVVLEKLAENTASMPEVTGTAAHAMATFKTTIQNTKDRIGVALLPALSVLMGVLGDLAERYGPMIIASVQKIGEWLGENLPPMIERAQTWFNEKLLPAIAVVQTFIQTKVIPIIQKLVAWIGTDAPKATSKLTDFWNNVLLPAIQEVARFFTEQWNQIKGWVDDNMPLIQSTIDTVMGAIRSIIETVSGVIQGIWEWLWPHLGEVAGGAWEIIKNLVTTAIGVVEGIIKAVMLAIQGDWTGAWESVKGALVIAWEGIKTHIKLTLDTILGIFGTSMDGIWTAIKKKWENIRLGTRMKLLEIRDAIIGFKDKFIKSGEDLINGVKEGIQNKVAALKQKAVDALSSALQAIKDAFGISSPSTVFALIGDNVAEGVAMGIDRSTTKVLSSVNDMMVKTLLTAQAGMGDVKQLIANELSITASMITEMLGQTKQLLSVGGKEYVEEGTKKLLVWEDIAKKVLVTSDVIRTTGSSGSRGGGIGDVEELNVKTMNVELVTFADPTATGMTVNLTQNVQKQDDASLARDILLLQMLYAGA